jgi:hypothetical protein
MSTVAALNPVKAREFPRDLDEALDKLRTWVETRDYSGWEPYDVLNSPLLRQVTTSDAVAPIMIQSAKRFGQTWMRNLLRVPASKNPKALGLFLASYCDLIRCGFDCQREIRYIVSELKRLRSANETDYCWGYDWNYVSFRGNVMPAFYANSIATVFCGGALLDTADAFNDTECEQMADSVARFLLTRLNRSVDTQDHLCFSYTPLDRTLIYNNSALIGAFLARVGARRGYQEFLDLAKRAMQYLADEQRADGAWYYGARRRHRWVDGFHTGYNLCALRAYRRYSQDGSFDGAISRGYDFYKRACFTTDGVPKYYATRLYPIDIHSCSQAVLTFCEFAAEDSTALDRALAVARWTCANMRSPDGVFCYQRKRFTTDRTPYMRWGQAWMMRALTRLRAACCCPEAVLENA